MPDKRRLTMNLFCKLLLFIMKITVAIFFSNSRDRINRKKLVL